MKKKVLGLLLILTLASCKHRMVLREIIDTPELKAKVSNNDALRRNSYFIVQNGRAITLSEPPPDAAISQITEITNKLKLTDKVDTEQSVKLTEALTSLGQRTVAVNILRDALFRLNEHNVNSSKPMDNMTYELFNKILNVSSDIAEADKDNAKAKATNAQTELIRVSDVIAMENQAYENLTQKDWAAALKGFKDVEKKYPSYHNAYEIGNLLQKYQNKTMTESDWREVFKKVLKDYSWKMPDDIKAKMKVLSE